jgi:hypothetical protein
MRRHSRFIALATSVVVAAGLLTGVTSLVQEAPAQAAESAEAASTADARNFNAGNIISDGTFYNAAAMTPDSIQSFLNSRVVTCKGNNGQSCLKDYRSATAARAATPYCAALGGSSNETAASVIYRVSQACGINPQVLLVMLQKEQGLVTSTGPTATAYKIAMGYGCPDTAACDSQYYGFANQVYNAAHQFQRYTKTSSSWSYQPGRTSNILYNPNAACGSKSVTIANQATANLYIYTPYTPNQSALNAGYGTGDACGAYGNRNFYLYFTDWFGSPSNYLQSSSFEGGSVSGWNWSNGAINRAAYNMPTVAKEGNYFLATNTGVAGRAVTQDVARTTNVGEQANATIWVRSGSTKAFSGKAVLWGLGGAQENAVVPFSVGPNWTKVDVKLPVRKSAHSVIRLDIYMDSTGIDLFTDATSLSFSQAPKLQNDLVNPSFEGSFANWVPGNGFMNQQIYQHGAAKDGGWFAASNTPVAGRSFAQTINASTVTDQTWTFSVWLRSAENTTFKGRVALWGLGGSSNAVEVTPFTVGTEWTQVTVTTDMGKSGARQLKAEVYLDQTGTTLWLDGARLSDNLLTSGGFEHQSSTGWTRGHSSMNLALYSNAQGYKPQKGGWMAATNTGAAGSSLSQTVAYRPIKGETFTAEVWVKSGSSKPFSGRLALWGLGGATEGASTPFTTTGTWTKLKVQLPVGHDDHTQFKFEIYEDSTDATLWLDTATVY